MYTILFTDKITGEDFFVVANSIKEAREIAKKYFECPRFIDVVSEEYAEMCGYDTY